MAMFKYIGDNERTECFGVAFQKGKPSKVDDPRAIAKLENNSEFQKVDGRTKAAKK